MVGTALEYGLTLLPEQVETALESCDTIERKREVQGAEREFITTREVLDAERRMLAFARGGRGTRRRLVEQEHVFSRDWLNDQQKLAIRHVLNSRDTVTAIAGGAGTGKSSLMVEAVEAIEQNGKEVFTFAPSTGACEVLKEKGFEWTQTVEHLLRNTSLQSEVKDRVLWIDEAGLVDVRSMNGIFKIAKEQNTRVILSGDTRQHSSPRRGEAMRLLEAEAGLNVARIEAIERQKGRYREAVALIGRGHEVVDQRTGQTGLLAGFDMLDRMGKIKQIAHEERHEVLARQYVSETERGRSTLVVAPTHAEGQAVTEKIRHSLRQRGAIGKEDRQISQLKSLNLSEAEKAEPASYRAGSLVVQFHQNVKGGYKRGERYQVQSGQNGILSLKPVKGGQSKPVPYGFADRFEVYSENQIGLTTGDKVRFSLGGTAVDGKRRIANGRLDEVKDF